MKYRAIRPIDDLKLLPGDFVPRGISDYKIKKLLKAGLIAEKKEGKDGNGKNGTEVQ